MSLSRRAFLVRTGLTATATATATAAFAGPLPASAANTAYAFAYFKETPNESGDSYALHLAVSTRRAELDAAQPEQPGRHPDRRHARPA
jgi:hypothetical protein